MKNDKVAVKVDLDGRGQAVLSALERAGIDPSDAVACEIERRWKARMRRSKKFSPRVGGI